MHLLIENPKFRLFWTAGLFGDVSMIAYYTVHGWLALLVTDSPFWVGATAGVGGIALTVFAPWGGVLVDRFPKIDVVQVASVIRGTMAVVLATLVFTDSVQLWHVLAFSVAQGAAASIRVPGMKTLAMDIAGAENLLAATAARMASMTVVGVVIPLAVGPAVDAVGIGWAYVVIAIADLTSIALMSVVRPQQPNDTSERPSPFAALKSGIGYSLRHPLVRTILGVMVVTELFGWSVEPMLPVVVRDVLGGGATGLGMLFAAASGGAAVTAVALSSLRNVPHRRWIMVGGMIGFGFFLLLFSLSRSLPLSLVLFALAGAFTTLYETTADTILQSGVDRKMRGRVLSLQAMLWGVSGMSGFHTGAMANAFGAPLAIGIGAVIVMVAGLALARFARRLDRPVQYRTAQTA